MNSRINTNFIKNKLTTIIRVAEKQYYANKLLEMKDNISKTWKLLNQMTCRNTLGNRQVREIDVDGLSITNPQTIVEKFNKFFSNVGPDLAKKISKGNKSPINFLKGNYPNSLFL